MIDLKTESAVTLTVAAQLPELRRNGKSLNPATIFRWASRGIARGGRRHVLETVQQAGARVTTREAIARFFAALSACTGAAPEPAIHNDDRDQDAAEKELAAQGFDASGTPRAGRRRAAPPDSRDNRGTRPGSVALGKRTARQRDAGTRRTSTVTSPPRATN